MAKVSYWSAWWFSPGDLLFPGEAHGWWMVGFQFGDVLDVTAHPIMGSPFVDELAVQDLRIQKQPTGGTLLFTVRNVGNHEITAYKVAGTIVSK